MSWASWVHTTESVLLRAEYEPYFVIDRYLSRLSEISARSASPTPVSVSDRSDWNMLDMSGPRHAHVGTGRLYDLDSPAFVKIHVGMPRCPGCGMEVVDLAGHQAHKPGRAPG